MSIPSTVSSRSRSRALPASSRTYRYPYRAIVPGAPLAPVVSVIVRGPRAHIPIRGLVDSGADNAMLPVEFAEHLVGIDLASCRREECNTAGGLTTQHVWPDGLDAEVQGINVTIRLKTSFSETPVFLLGRHDFFASFVVQFDQRAQQFTLETYG